MDISVFGTGYVGLVQAAVLAEVGHHVLCVDVDEQKVKNLQKGIIPIYEPGLSKLVDEASSSGGLRFTANAQEGVDHGDVIFIAVGTPPDEDGSADLRYVVKVAQTIGSLMNGYKVVVNKSTVPVGTADKVNETVRSALNTRQLELSFDVVSNPEFLKEGAAVADCKKPDRIVLGLDSERAERIMRELYAPFSRNHEKIITMDQRSAELTKYAANCMLATKISFMNEIANIAEHVGADIENVRKGIGSDTRIGYHFIYAGCGYGGSCFPKDLNALVRSAGRSGYTPLLLNAIEAVNTNQKRVLFNHVNQHFLGDLAGKTIAVWGLAFKPNTDDMREAPSRYLMEDLWAAGAKVQAYDPEAMNECQRIYGSREDLHLMGTREAALQGADALVICTEWKQFKVPDIESFKNRLKRPVVIDGRNLYDPATMLESGISYYGIGRGLSVKTNISDKF